MLRTCLLGTLLASSCWAATLEVALVPEATVRERLESGSVRLQLRQAVIKGLFEKAGCAVVEQPVNKHFGNVICTLPGRTDSTIVVGGHFDFVDMGKGIVDDWSGSSMLPSIYDALKAIPRRHTYVFVAFAAEERWMVGSTKFVESLSAEQRSEIRGFVNLECLGLTPVKVWVNRSSPELVARLIAVAKAIQIPVSGVNVEEVGDDDTRPFVSAKLPVISIHSLTQETLPIIHSHKDRVEAIHFDEYYSAYKLVSYYLAYLDAKLG